MPLNINSVVSFRDTPVAMENRPAPAEGFISGNAIRRGAQYFKDNTGKFRSGVWESTPGKWKAIPEKNEFCYIIEGKVSIADSQGNEKIYVAGDAFLIPMDFDGTWEVLETTKKYFVAYG